MMAFLFDGGMLDPIEAPLPCIRCIRSAKRLPVMYTDENGEERPCTPTTSMWYGMYYCNPKIDNPLFLKMFWARFRLPYESFLELVEKMKPLPQFQHWQKSDATKTPSAPLSLLLLGALRILGRSWTFCDVYKATGISTENVRQFFTSSSNGAGKTCTMSMLGILQRQQRRLCH
jgi:hypothetical protein